MKKSSSFEQIKEFLIHFVGLHSSPTSHRLGVVSYGANPRLDLDFSQEQDDETIAAAIKRIK